MVLNLFEKLDRAWVDSLLKDAPFRNEFPNPDKKINFNSIGKRSFTASQIAAVIDHTILKANAQSAEIEQLCNEALEYKFASVCINPFYVPLCAEILKGSDVKVCTVIGFPLGANEAVVKKNEAEQAINNGADEVDMVVNIGKIKDGDYEYVYRDIAIVVDSAKLQNKIIKVIIETCYLTDEEKIRACLAAARAGADFVKSSTGFGTGGAVAADIALMAYIAGGRMKVKASGGIRSREDAEIMMSCGADRLGTSSGVKIIRELTVK